MLDSNSPGNPNKTHIVDSRTESFEFLGYSFRGKLRFPRGKSNVEQVTDVPEPDVLSLAAKVYVGLSDEDLAEIEKLAAERGSFFNR